MKSQLEQIRNAERAYIMPLNHPRDGMSTHRFQVYLMSPDGLDVLWPHSEENGKREKLLAGQVFSKRDAYPTFHFALAGCGYSKTYDIGETLRRINPKLKVEVINGWSPSNANGF